MVVVVYCVRVVDWYKQGAGERANTTKLKHKRLGTRHTHTKDSMERVMSRRLAAHQRVGFGKPRSDLRRNKPLRFPFAIFYMLSIDNYLPSC